MSYLMEDTISMSYDKVQHLVDVDANIFAAFVIDPIGSISHLFIAPDSDLNKSKIEEIASVLDIKSTTTSKRVVAESLIGHHKWDVLEYEKFKFIKLYPSGNVRSQNDSCNSCTHKGSGGHSRFSYRLHE